MDGNVRRIVAAMLLAAWFFAVPGLAAGEASHSLAGAPAKYVFLFIGDGMGPSQVRAAETVLRAKSGAGAFALSALPVRGTAATRSADFRVTDSAAAATALASGRKTANGVIGMDPAGQAPLESIAEAARDRGFKVGIVTSVPLDHATPAAFYAHRPSRKDLYEISLQMSGSGLDYFAGGPFTRPTGPKKDATDSVEAARSRGYRVVLDKEGFTRLSHGAGKTMVFTRVASGQGLIGLSLAELTAKGVELLEGPAGFFMVVEGGKIDWACHANDAAGAVAETLAFDGAVDKAVAFARRHPEETLVVVTGDHETGGMAFDPTDGAAAAKAGRILSRQGSAAAFEERFSSYRKKLGGKPGRLEDVLPLARTFFGLREPGLAASKDPAAREEPDLVLTDTDLRSLREAFSDSLAAERAPGGRGAAYLRYGGCDPLTITLTRLRDGKAGIRWGTCSHTDRPVPVHALGRGQELFAGPCDNTDIPKRIRQAMGF